MKGAGSPSAEAGSNAEPLRFEALRAEGVALTQALSGQLWTDYNLHDPGVTLLEALCYGLSDLAYRADFPVQDLLAGRDLPSLALHAPEQVFPCRATTLGDMRRVVLDAVTGLDDAQFSLPGDGVSSLPGLLQLSLKLTPGHAQGGAGTGTSPLAEARAAYRRQRNLGEDLIETLRLVKPRGLRLHLELDLQGARDAAEVLADLCAACARHIARPLAFQGADQLWAQGQGLDQIYTGPLTPRGLLDEQAGLLPEWLHVSDLGALVRAVPGVRQLRKLGVLIDADPTDQGPPAPSNLAADADPAPVFQGAVPWQGEGWCLSLQLPGLDPALRSAEQLAAYLEPHVQMWRGGGRVRVLPSDVAARMADRVAMGRAREAGRLCVAPADLPQGTRREAGPYRPVQDELPPVYGIGPYGLPSQASAQRQAQALQLKGYLSLFDQLMANGAAQLAALPELFSPRGAEGASYWQQMLTPAQVPGLEALYLDGQALSATDIYSPFDPAADRKSRVLDHLLALYGVQHKQTSLRQYLNFLSSSELDDFLLDNKASLLRQVLAFTQDRLAGVDHSQPCWNLPDGDAAPCAGLQRRVGLLLGYRRWHPRSLTQPFVQRQRVLLGDAEYRQTVGDESLWVAEPSHSHPLPLHLPRPPLSQASLSEDLRAIAVMRRPQLSESLLRCALQRERYRLQRVEAEADGEDVGDGQPPANESAQDRADPGPHSARSLRLVLGPDDTGRWWRLCECASPMQAYRAAESLRQVARSLTQDSEGLHLVEHVLLRPLGASPEHAALYAEPDWPSDFHTLRLSLVFPLWPLRSQEPNFRLFVDDTVRQQCPAHLLPDCLWLGFEAMCEFEGAWSRWLQARQQFELQSADAEDPVRQAPLAARDLNQASAALIRFLRQAKAQQATWLGAGEGA